MTLIAFITPVHERPGITAVCLGQRRDMLDELARRGIDGVSVVVGCDENLATAADLEMEVVEQRNELGRKINDGIEHACRRLGATHVCFIGSDQWLHPDYLTGLTTDRIRTGCGFAAVSEDGRALAHMTLRAVHGCGPKVIPTAHLERRGLRPCDDRLMRSLDQSLMAGVLDGDADPFEWVDPPGLGSMRYVDFKNRVTQIHSYRSLRRLAEHIENPWAALARHYPLPRVIAMQDVYRTVPA